MSYNKFIKYKSPTLIKLIKLIKDKQSFPKDTLARVHLDHRSNRSRKLVV